MTKKREYRRIVVRASRARMRKAFLPEGTLGVWLVGFSLASLFVFTILVRVYGWHAVLGQLLYIVIFSTIPAWIPLLVVYIWLVLFAVPADIYVNNQELIATLETAELPLDIKHFGTVREIKGKKERFVECEFINSGMKRITDLDIKIAKIDVYNVASGELFAHTKFSLLGKIKWGNGEEIITLDPESPIRTWLVYTDTETGGFVFNTPSISHGSLRREIIMGFELRLKGKLEGENEFHFFTHNAYVYGNNEQERIGYRLQFLEQLYGKDINIPNIYWTLIEQSEKKNDSAKR